MDVREKTRKVAEPLLDESEIVQAVFVAGFPRGGADDPTFNVVSTNQRILVFAVSGWRAQKLTFQGTLPRSTRFGPVHGLEYSVPALGGRWIGRKFFKDVEASDAAAAS